MRLINTLFSTIFGRRLGTTTDGTSKRTNALTSGTIDSDINTQHFSNNQRRRKPNKGTLEIDYLSRVRRQI